MKKVHENKVNVAEMRMLRWMSGVTLKDKIRNEYIRGTLKVGELSGKMQERRLNWFGHILRKEDEYIGRQVMAMQIEGHRGRGRPKFRWKDRIKQDLESKGLREEQTADRRRWKLLARNSDPI